MIETAGALKINVDKELNKSVTLAKKLYLEGSIFIYPTDTIYGIGANPFNENAVKKINEIKGREEDKKNILLIYSIENLLEYVSVPSEKYLDFLLAIWPNPVSVVLSLNKKYREILNTSNIAFRIPNHRFCLKLLKDRKSTRLNSSHIPLSRMPSSA